MKTCPLCGGGEFKLIATEIREGEGRIVQCRGCNLVMQDLQMSQEEVFEYYDDEYQRTNSLVAGVAQSAVEHFQDRIKTIRPLFEMIKPRLKPSFDVLEIGCGAGELLSLIKPLVRTCVGVELNRAFIEHVKSALAIEAYAADFLTIDFGRQFDLIIMVDTLDHLPNPREVLLGMKGLLKPEGFLWITVPNRNEALNFFLPEPNLSAYRKFFWHKAHFFYYTRETIAKLFDAVGMEAEIACYHQYTLKNYLKWYFVGKPQANYIEGATDYGLFSGGDPFEVEMNRLLQEANARFHDIVQTTFRGDSLSCYVAPKKEKGK